MPTRDTRAAYFGGGGEILVFLGANPAAGTEVSITVPVGKRWRFLSAKIRLVTDANVATRFVRAFFQDAAGNAYHHGSADATHAASTGRDYVISDADPGGLPDGQDIAVPVASELLMQAGHVFRTVTSSLQAGDNWAVPILLVEEWVDLL